MDATAAQARSADRAAFWAALAVGVVARVALLDAKPFWRDEAWVALLAADPMRAAHEGRPVPLGFLLVTRLAGGLPLAPEVALRLLPLAAGLALLPLLARLGRALGAPERTAVAAVWLAAGMPALVYYSRELKPYALDALLAVVVPLLALGWRERPGARIGLVICLAAAPWVSFGALFPILAVLGWGSTVGWRRADAAARRAWVVAVAVFAASLAAAYAVAWQAQLANQSLRTFWAPVLFASTPLSAFERALVAMRWYVTTSVSYFFPTVWPPVVALAVVGACTWPRPRRAYLAWLWLGTSAACIGAAATDHYLTAAGRLLLFAAPPLVLWVAHGLVVVTRWLRAPALALVVAAALGVAWSWDVVAHRLRPYRTDRARYFRYDVLQNVDAMIADAAAVVPAGEPVMVSRYAAYAFQLYAGGRLPQAVYCEISAPDVDAFTRAWLARLGRRGWVILTDEEVAGLDTWFAAQGLARTTRAGARGAALWEVVRPGS